MNRTVLCAALASGRAVPLSARYCASTARARRLIHQLAEGYRRAGCAVAGGHRAGYYVVTRGNAAPLLLTLR